MSTCFFCTANLAVQFLIKGVVYRLHGEGPLDPLVDDRLEDLQRDITLFKQLGLNTLFICGLPSEPSSCYPCSMT